MEFDVRYGLVCPRLQGRYQKRDLRHRPRPSGIRTRQRRMGHSQAIVLRAQGMCHSIWPLLSHPACLAHHTRPNRDPCTVLALVSRVSRLATSSLHAPQHRGDRTRLALAEAAANATRVLIAHAHRLCPPVCRSSSCLRNPHHPLPASRQPPPTTRSRPCQ